MNKTVLSLAPLQGFTEYPYRNALHKIIGGIDKYYTPYLRLQNDESLKKKNIKDILPENNSTPLTPQILVNNSNDFIHLAQIISDHGYQELNLNLGCPYPMVTNRELGAGLLTQPNRIIYMLEEALPKINISVSIKMRLGMYNAKDIANILPQFNQFPISEIIIHPRIAKQLYRGSVNLDAFRESLSVTEHKLAYNGDITTLEQFQNIQNTFKSIKHFMIGRGLLNNPFLAQEIINNKTFPLSEKLEKLHEFHNLIFAFNKQATSGNTHLLNKMIQFWSYFAFSFSESKKIIKSIKKCKNEKTYLKLTNVLFDQ